MGGSPRGGRAPTRWGEPSAIACLGLMIDIAGHRRAEQVSGSSGRSAHTPAEGYCSHYHIDFNLIGVASSISFNAFARRRAMPSHILNDAVHETTYRRSSVIVRLARSALQPNFPIWANPTISSLSNSSRFSCVGSIRTTPSTSCRRCPKNSIGEPR
jgi:hypothetical protein